MRNEDWLKVMVESIEETVLGQLANMGEGYRIMTGPPSAGVSPQGSLQLSWEWHPIEPGYEPHPLPGGWTIYGPLTEGAAE